MLGKTRDFRLGTIDMHGSKDVVELVARTPGAIGYSGMGYATDRVRMLRIARKHGETAYTPGREYPKDIYPSPALSSCIPWASPKGAQGFHLEWIHSPEGQDLVVRSGYVSLSRTRSHAPAQGEEHQPRPPAAGTWSR